MNFTLKVMGSASAKPVIDRFQSAQVLDVHGRSFLIDCGEGVQIQLQRFGVSIQKLDSVFISHIHGDHVFGIFGLLSTMGMLGRITPLNIYAPHTFAPILKFFLSYYGEGLKFEIRFTPLKMKSPEVIYETKTLQVSAFPLNHGIETFGYKFSEKLPQRNVRKEAVSKFGLTLTEIASLKRGENVVRNEGTDSESVISAEEYSYVPWIPRSLAYCLDTSPFPELSEWVRDVDILYHETTYLKNMSQLAEQRHHSTTIQAAQTAKDAHVKRLVIAHYSSRERCSAVYEAECRSIFPETYAASDGSVFDIPLIKFE